MIAKCSIQDRVGQARVPGEALVERDQFVVARHAERGQVRVVPDVRRECVAVSKGPPMRFNVGSFAGEGNPGIAQVRVVLLPGVDQCQDVFSNDFRIGCQSQETLLGHPAEEEQFVRQSIEPGFCGGMVDVRIERHRDPNINIGKKQRLLHRRSPRCVRWSGSWCRVHPSERAEPGLASSPTGAMNQVPGCTKP